ncbi:aldo/keto reductase [Calidifontibacter sp. DB0510]|uniref:Aldo/keto reductase n=1 Tax=Metallococcus carri TaxID=1656884 RepID=A0A967AYF2_9MICO|nr:aldo/keto reductase [Metallococcus carri]NHN54727.1 aldo/keto reductase [Metallococcus carri]NOP37072.1 aldo/keto reductase [Calidifontibacter sp. DB2511S]
MSTVQLADLTVSPIGFGCMALSHVYGGTSDDAARATLDAAIDAGITFLDTADVYGEPREGTTGPSGTNEEMLAPLLARRRDEVQLATKFGILGARWGKGGTDDSKATDGRPAYVRSACEASLRRLGVDTIDLYYLHRPDPDVPVEETVGAMAQLVADGKVRHLGLSEVTADELRRAHAVHPITAVQSEWSLWSRDVERYVVPACAELGVGFVPYSPLGRGFLTGTLTQEQVAGDFRGGTSRMGEGWDANQQALAVVAEVARAVGATNAQVALAWLLHQGTALGASTVPIPGSRTAERMIENLGAVGIRLDDEQMARLDTVAGLVQGDRNIVDNPAWISSGRE